jgi:hypothetical protein
MKSVNDLKKGADTILELSVASLETEDPLQIPIVAPTEVLHDLSRSIQYRTMFSESKFGTATGGDQGHQYMIDVLRYCRSILRFSRHVAKVAIAEDLKKNPFKEPRDVDGIGGRFNALMLDEEDEEEEEKEDLVALEQNIRWRKFPNFQAPKAPAQEIDIEQGLINGDDRFQAVALLRTMDDLMSVVDGHYGLLKSYLRDPQRRSDGGSVQLLMECAVAANMAVESVHAAEHALATHHPHMSSFYHVLALVFLPSYVADIEALMSTSKIGQGDSHMVLQFVAEIVECSFHNRGDQRIPAKVNAFVKKSGLQFAVVQEEARKISMITMVEVQLANEEPMNSQINALFARMSGVRPHMWLQRSAFIGGDACLLNTQKLVQMLMCIVKDSNKLVGRPGFWGKSFDEQTSPARRIRGDMNEAFAGCIMPELIELCKRAPWQQLPDTTPLMTVVDLLHRHLHGGDRTRPVSVALTFGLHAMLTSIFVLQGDGDLARIAAFSKQSYNTLFEQLDDISDPSKPPENAPTFYWNVGIFKQVVNFAKQLKPHNFNPEFPILDPVMAERLAYWNPLIGGEYMLYATYICSIGVGSATVDSLGQLRFTLHLYNALKQQDPSLDVPFLKHLDKVFANTKAIWVGGRPTKGSYCKHFWLAWGSSLAEATRMASNLEELPSFLQNPQPQHETNLTR